MRHRGGQRAERERERKGELIRVELNWEVHSGWGGFLQDDTHRPGSGARAGAVRGAEARKLGLPELEGDRDGEQEKGRLQGSAPKLSPSSGRTDSSYETHEGTVPESPL